MKTNKNSYFWRAVFVLTTIVVLAGTVQMAMIAGSYNVQILHSDWIYLISFVAVFLLAIIALLIVSWTRWADSLLEWPESIIRFLHRYWKVPSVIVGTIMPLLFAAAILHPYTGKYYFSGWFTRLALGWCLALSGMFCVKSIKESLSWLYSLGISALILTAFYAVAVSFSNISTYPFALSWSEVSRFFGASLFFSERIYDVKVSLSIMHPAWHLLLSVPFLLGNMPIWVHRLWQAVLQVGLTTALSFGMVKRLDLRNRLQIWLVFGWVFLYLIQMPVLIHLIVCALIVVSAVRPGHFWSASLAVLVASFWAGLCRVNWFPVPALIVIMLYLLETPIKKPKQWIFYLWKPAFWLLAGTSVAVASNIFFMSWSGNSTGINFSSSLTSDLLWYRLLPNATYPHGILPDLLIFSLPLFLVITFSFRRWRYSFHSIRWLGIFGVLLVLCIGGIVVSVKIGGGSDLHNLDAFFILLLLVTTYLFFGKATPEPGKSEPRQVNQYPMNLFLVTLGIMVPACFVLQKGQPVITWNHLQAEQEISAIKGRAEAAAREGGEILFISQRHLLTLGMVNVPLVSEYEQDFLMEMVMSHNRAYLDRFQADLRAHRFALIIAGPQNVRYYGNKSLFGEENDLWVQEVSIPLLCYYQSIPSLDQMGVLVFVPSQNPCE